MYGAILTEAWETLSRIAVWSESFGGLAAFDRVFSYFMG